MQIFDRFEIVDGQPALYDSEEHLLAIADLHLGIESVMARKGTYFPRVQVEEVIDQLETVCAAVDADTLLVNGDIKHQFSGSSRGEDEDVEAFLNAALKQVEQVILVKGNHDNYVAYAVDSYDAVELVDYHVQGDVCYTHGHKMPEALDAQSVGTVVIGHEHPALALEDDAGVTEKIPTFLYGLMQDDRQIIVLPAFSTLAEGTPINRSTDSDLLSPYLQSQTDIGTLHAIGVDTEAGTLPFTTIEKLRTA